MNKTTKFKKLAACLVLTVAMTGSSASAQAASESNMGLYGGLDIGAWKYWFSQGGNGQTVNLSGDVSVAFQAAVGLRVSSFFLEYTPAYFVATVAEDADLERDGNDASWNTYKAGNFGVTIPVLHLEVYGGGGHSCLDFSFGADSEYCGLFARAGVGIVLGRAPYGSIRIKGEFIRQFISSDEAGSLPDGLSTTSNVAFVGFSFAFGGK